MKKVGLVVSFLLLLSSQLFAENEATYHPETGVLEIPKVIVGANTFDVEFQQSVGWNFYLTEATVISDYLMIDISSYASLTGDYNYRKTFNGLYEGNWSKNFQKTDKLNQNRVFIYQEFDNNGYESDKDYFLTDMSQGLYRTGGVSDSRGEWFFNPAMPVLLSSFIPGKEYTYNYYETETEQSGTWSLVIEQTNVTVPFGTFQDCYKTTNIRQEGSARVTIIRWFAKNVGLVKYQQIVPGEYTQTWELASYIP